jgi:3-phenylpropionate/cinnamic acid dioxygenase small subunit
MSILSETQTATFKPLIQFDLPLSTNDAAQQQRQQQQERKLVIFNSNLQANRREIVSIRVNTPHIEIYDDTKKQLVDNVQVSLVWPNMEGGALSVDTSE